jgi:hypothetical protein
MQFSSFNVPAQRWEHMAVLHTFFRKAILVIAAVITLGLFCQVSVAQESRALTFEAACQQAAATQKLVAVEFFSYKSVESKIMRVAHLSKPAVMQLLAEKFVFTSVEFEKTPELCRKYGITRVPIVLLFKPDGVELDRIGYRVTNSHFLEFLRASAEGRVEFPRIQLKIERDPDSEVTHLALADRYAQRRQGEAALREYLWCLNHVLESKDKTHLKTVSTVIRRLAALGVELPAAKQALCNLRDQMKSEIDEASDAEKYRRLFSCNDALKESSRNLEVYLSLPEKSDLRAQLFSLVFFQLVEQRKYREAISAVDLEVYLGNINPRDQSAEKEASFESHMTDESQSSSNSDAEAHSQMVIEWTLPAVEALLATGQAEKARLLAGRVLESDKSRLLRIRLMEVARRAGSVDAALFCIWVKDYNQPQEAARATPSHYDNSLN